MRKTLTPALVLLLVATVGLTGCATKKYVDEQISAFGQVTNTKIHEVQDATEGNQKAISDLSAKQDGRRVFNRAIRGLMPGSLDLFAGRR